jgi:4'-phosphopantetheinyl transferase
MSTVWSPPPAGWGLHENEVHVWRVQLDRAGESVATLAALLSPEEEERAERFYWVRERDRFVVARGLLRVILGRYLDAPAASLRFTQNEHGKPSLERNREKTLSFNISHSGGVALFAFTRERALGVDIERLRTDLDYERLAARFFSPAEVAQLACLNDTEQRVAAFFRCWTRKEAYIKGQGIGLALGLQSFDVTLAPGEPAQLVATRPDAGEAARWQLQGLDPAPGYAAALAVKGWDWRLQCWTWEGHTAY